MIVRPSLGAPGEIDDDAAMSRSGSIQRTRAAGAGARRSHGAAIVPVIGAAMIVGCSAEPAPVRTVGAAATSAVEAPSATAIATTSPVAEYLLPDVERRAVSTWVLLEKGRYGVLIDGARAIATEGGVTIVPETADTGIRVVERIPARLGGGFLFRTNGALYASATFDGPLRPVVTIGGISSVSFGPDSTLVRDYTGQRWSIDLATGARRAPTPVGLADVAALDDGRAIAILEGGGVSVSVDSGKTWTSANAQLQGSPSDVSAREGELWLGDRQGSRPLRLERSGVFVEMSAMPPTTTTTKPDPRFGSGDSPLRMALRAGARIGPWTAVIGAGGDVMRVDLATGAIVTTFAGVIPLRMSCEAIEIPDDVALVCAEKSKASVVVTNLLHGKKPRVERSFPTDGPFFAGEDGALAFGGPCGTAPDRPADPSAQATSTPFSSSGIPDVPLPTVCVRNGDGQWEPFLLDEANGAAAGASSSSPRKGAPASSASTSAKTSAPSTSTRSDIRPEDVRWIPRLGRAPVAVVSSMPIASYDAAWGEIREWQTAAQTPGVLDALRRSATPRSGSPIVDRRWVATSTGAVSTILDDGRGVEVSPEGVLQVWPFTFDRVASCGPLAFARGGGGRAFQTLDRGRTWDEVAAPPGLQTTFDPRDCSPLGCELGTWVRIGWNPTPPAPKPDVKKAAAPPMLPVVPTIELACLTTGRNEARAITPSPDHSNDQALGASRLPSKFDDPSFAFDLVTLGRAGVGSMRASFGNQIDTAPRAMTFGFHLILEASDDPKDEWGRVAVEGPSRASSAYKMDLLFVEPLVPSAPIRHATLKLDGIAKAIKDAGVALPALVQAEALNVLAVAPITPAAKARTALSGDVIFTLSPTSFGTLYVIAHGGASPRAEAVFAQGTGVIQNAARLANGDLAALAVDESGAELILRISGSTVTEVAQLPPPSLGAAPPNTDAIAIGPKGELGVIRTPSGKEPPSVADPALLLFPGPKLTALAPWASALPASDAACSAGADDMYRATVQTNGTWVRIAGHAVPIETLTGMTARVRWSPTRLCIEGLEVPDGISATMLAHTTEATVIATFAPDEASRVDIEPGSEARVSMSCTLQPR